MIIRFALSLLSHDRESYDLFDMLAMIMILTS